MDAIIRQICFDNEAEITENFRTEKVRLNLIHCGVNPDISLLDN